MTKQDIRPYTPDEIKLIMSCKYTVKELSVLLNRSTESIKGKKYSLRNPEKMKDIKKRRKNNYYKKFDSSEHKGEYWSQEELKLIMNSKYTDSQLSEMLGRSMNSITVKRHRLKKEKKNGT